MNYYAEVWKKYAVFHGRARRKEYWTFTLWNTLIYFLLSILGAIGGDSILGTASHILSWIFVLAILIPSIAVMVRRIHDISQSGWWLLIGLVPGIGELALLIFAVVDSMPGDNRYGPNPKGVVAIMVNATPKDSGSGPQ